MLNLTMADAGIASWDTKYAYDFWRPIRGIRMLNADGNAMDDGNPDTEADADWTPLGAPCTNCPPGSTNFTPPFPAYTSGHATFGGAAFQTLINFFGRDDISFTFVSDEYNGVNKAVDGSARPLKPRSFDSFSQATEENGQSRIYLGVHWAFDKTEGIKQGKAIADQAFDRLLEPIRRRGDDRHDQDHSCSNDRFIAWRGTHQRDDHDRSWRDDENAGDDDDLVAGLGGNHG